MRVAGLTEALATLATAEEAKTDFLESLDGLNTDLNENTGENGIDVEAGKAAEGDITTFYSNASTAMQSQTGVSNFASRSATVQDAAIAERTAELEETVETETADAEDGMTGLLSTLEARQETLAEKQQAVAEAQEAYNDEVTAFEAVNTTVTVGTAATNVNFVNGEFGVLGANGDITTVYAELVDGQWELTAAGETAGTSGGELKGIADLYTQSQALESANAAEQTALDAVQETVEDIILLESGGYEVASNGSAFDEATGAVDLSANDATVYETEADADAGAGTKAVYTIDLAGAATDGSTQETVTIGGATAYADTAAGDAALDAAGLASAIVAGNTISIDGVTYDIAAGNTGTEVVLTAQSAANVTSDVTVAGATTLPSKTTFATTVDGEAAGSTASVDLSDAKALSDAIAALEGFEEQVSAFEQARELNTELEGLQQAIDDAEAAIENAPDNEDAPGLGVTLADFVDSNATSDSEVFLFEDKEGTTVTIGDFGTGGQDQIYFGEGYSLVELGDKAITDNVGDSGAMEIFYEEEGSNLNLYVEAETFGGNSAGEADLTKIVLTGVSSDDISNNLSNGFLSAGEVA